MENKYDFVVRVDNAEVEVKEVEPNFYACYIRDHDMYFSSKKDQGMEMVHRKTRAMIWAKEKFERMYSMMLNRN